MPKGGLLLAMLLWLAGCGATAQPTQPTALPAPTLLPTPAPPPTATPLPTPTLVPTAVPGVLYVDAGQGLGPISPFVYGTNYGPWCIVPYDLMPQAEAAGITYLRFPGGNWGDQNDLTEFQVDDFIALARKLGAEPSISVRLLGGTPEQAVALVNYARDRGYHVRYWSIGNEPNLFDKDEYDTVQYNAEWRTFAQAMKAADPEILLVGPDISQYRGNPFSDPHDRFGHDWMTEFLRANGDLVDVVSIHRYPFPTGLNAPPARIDWLRRNSREWDLIIPRLRATVREVTGRDLPVAVTEVNSHWSSATGGEATPDSFYNAIWWADVLGRLVRQRVDIVAHFALQSRTQVGGWGLFGRFEVRPTYYVYPIYRHFGRDLIYASSDDPDLSIYAALRDDGALTIMVINLGPQERSRPLLLDHAAASGPAEVWRFDAQHPAERIAEQALAGGDLLTLPAQSVTLYIVPQR